MNMLRIIGFLCLLCTSGLQAQSPAEWSKLLATTLMNTHPDSFCYDRNKPARWDYELGLYLKSLDRLWRQTGDAAYLQYIRKQMDFYIGEDGQIRTYKLDIFNIDHITPGTAALLLYQQTGQEKYRVAAQTLRKQLAQHPRTKEGGFWHKKRYPWQMWLDGLYMGEPFYAQYGSMFQEPENFDDIANQFIWMEKNARDAKTGLLYHAWDESREQQWANKTTGQSPHFWGRAMGWYAMALVDVLDFFPENHPKRAQLVGILQRLADAVVKVQDPASGVWYQVLDQGGRAGNYLEASASSMFTYALLKGTRLGYLDARFYDIGQKAYSGVLREFMVQDADGSWHLDKVCMVAGLGGNPYRDGSYEYYVSEPQRRDDLKGAAPFVMAGLELEKLLQSDIGKGKTVLLDRFFNNEYKKGSRFHYTWEDTENSGYSWWGDIFRDFGAKTASLDAAPTTGNLSKAQVYIIVDPDTRKETDKPNTIDKQHMLAIKNWVKAGGTLVLLANDTSNCEITNFNKLASMFGIRFSDKNRNMVKNNQFEQGAVPVNPDNPVFKTARKLYIKEISVLDLEAPAQALLSEGGDVIMATSGYGLGRVFALGDPWIYNEYVDGKKLPGEYDNFNAARDLSKWLLQKDPYFSYEMKDVAAAVEVLRKALVSGDRAALESITAKDLTYGHSSGKVENRKEFLDQVVSGRTDFTEITLTDQSIIVTGNIATVRHTLTAATNDAGKGVGNIQLSILMVWTKQNEGWKLLARQAVKKN